MSSDRGAQFIDERIIPSDFDWREYDTDEERAKVRPATAYEEQVAAMHDGTDNAEEGACWPWDKANIRGLRFRPGEVTLYAGINGNRKSMVTGQIAADLVRQGERVLLASFEMQPRKTLGRMLQQCAGAIPAPSYRKAWFRWTRGRMWVYDHLGMCQPRQAMAVARYAVAELGVRHVFIDPLMKVVLDPEDYKGQKDFVSKCCALAQANDIHVHLIAHARKGKNIEAGIDKWDVKGASEITDQVDNVCLVTKRDREEGSDEPNQWLEVAKQRNGEFEGVLGLYFDPKSLSFGEQPGKRWGGVSLSNDGGQW